MYGPPQSDKPYAFLKRIGYTKGARGKIFKQVFSSTLEFGLPHTPDLR